MTEVSQNTMVDGRYRILDRIGSGGMADVYRAQDTHLGREVALKVLHRRYAQDAEFVERFRREASSAAGLSHPNVVGVFDRGEHSGTYYIAMEYLTGRTLKQIIEAEATPPEAAGSAGRAGIGMDQLRVVDIGIQVLNGAGFGHRRGVIHRDLKPQNVIVDAEGTAKVTDFGIARAGASEMTETGSIMGTAHYLSPEQAQGHAVTASSDLYSVGVMLYEMLTGRLPFEGESAVSVALKHLNDPPPPISELRPDVNPTLESVVMAALAKDPGSRWQSAEEFAAALDAARAHVEAQGNGGQGTAAFAPVPTPVGPAPPPAADRDDRRGPRWSRWLIAALVVALLGAVAFAVTRPEKVDVPRVVGLTLLQAQTRLERAGFDDVKVQRVEDRAPRDRVVEQDPDAGASASKGSEVTLSVSNGPGTTIVPSLRGLTEPQASRELTRADLKATFDPEASESVPRGKVIRSSPAEGTRIERGKRVRVFVSSGPGLVTVPNVVGATFESAQSQLDDRDLVVRRVERSSDGVPEGDVISQSPAAGTSVEPGSQVTLTVSTGKEQVDVPDVVGSSEGSAVRALRRAGLRPSIQERDTDEPSEDGQVIDQRPTAGTEVERGDSVVIVVGRRRETPPTTPGATPPDGAP